MRRSLNISSENSRAKKESCFDRLAVTCRHKSERTGREYILEKSGRNGREDATASIEHPAQFARIVSDALRIARVREFLQINRGSVEQVGITTVFDATAREGEFSIVMFLTLPAGKTF